MKPSILLILVPLFFVSVIHAREPISGTTESRPKSAGTLQERLDRVILPRIDISSITIGEALLVLKNRGREIQDAPLLLNFTSKDPSLAQKKVRGLELKNVPFSAALRYLLAQAGAEFRIEANTIVIQSRGPAGPDTRTPEQKKSEEADAKAREAKLANVVIPSVFLIETSLAEALAVIRVRLPELSEGKVAANFVIEDPTGKITSVRIKNVKLTNAPYPAAIKAIADAAGAVVRYDEHAVVFVPRPTP